MGSGEELIPLGRGVSTVEVHGENVGLRDEGETPGNEVEHELRRHRLVCKLQDQVGS